MDPTGTYTNYPEKVDKYFTQLHLVSDIRLRSALWADLIQFIDDPLYPHRKYMSTREDKDLVNSELHVFLKQHGTHYFQRKNLRPRGRVYKDETPADVLTQRRYFARLRSCLLYLSQGNRRVRNRAKVPDLVHDGSRASPGYGTTSSMEYLAELDGVEYDSDSTYDAGRELSDGEPDVHVDTSPGSRVTRRSTYGQTQAPVAYMPGQIQILDNDDLDDGVIDLPAEASQRNTENGQLTTPGTRELQGLCQPTKPHPIPLFSSFDAENCHSAPILGLARRAAEGSSRNALTKRNAVDKIAVAYGNGPSISATTANDGKNSTKAAAEKPLHGARDPGHMLSNQLATEKSAQAEPHRLGHTRGPIQENRGGPANYRFTSGVTNRTRGGKSRTTAPNTVNTSSGAVHQTTESAPREQPQTGIQIACSTTVVGDSTGKSGQPSSAPVADMTRSTPPVQESRLCLKWVFHSTSDLVTKHGLREGDQSEIAQRTKNPVLQRGKQTAPANANPALVPTGTSDGNGGVNGTRCNDPPSGHGQGATKNGADTAAGGECVAIAQQNKRKPAQQPSADISLAEGGDGAAGIPSSLSRPTHGPKRRKLSSPVGSSPKATVDQTSTSAESPRVTPSSTTPQADRQQDLPPTANYIDILQRRKLKGKTEIFVQEEAGHWIRWPFPKLSEISLNDLFTKLASHYDVLTEQIGFIRFSFVDASTPTSLDVKRGQADGHELLRKKITEIVEADQYEGVFRVNASFMILADTKAKADTEDFLGGL